MHFQIIPRLMTCLLFILFFVHAYSAEENFLLVNDTSNETVLRLGPHTHQRMSPCCTFNIALSLMGYDAGILKDEKDPIWPFQAGYEDDYDSWKTSQTPLSWMKHSAVWYSKLLATQVGLETMQSYLTLFDYGNRDLTGGLTKHWLSSSLKISPAEQVKFIQKLIHTNLPISKEAFEKTKILLFKEELPEGWKLYGKTGKGSFSDPEGQRLEIVWFVGWVEKGSFFFPFAYNIREEKIPPGLSIPRVKQLLVEATVLSKIV